MLKTRIITAIFLLAGLLGALFFLPDTGWTAVCVLVCMAAGREWGALAAWGEQEKSAYAVALGALCLALLPSPERLGDTPFFVALIIATAFWALLVPFWLKYRWPLRSWIAALTGVIVLVPPSLAFIVLRDSFGPTAVLLAAAPVWVADIAAYFAGRAFGRAKLAPSISPGKTWAGAVGAAIGVMLYGTVLCVVTGFGFPFLETKANYPFVTVPLFSLLLTALSIEGDLFESLLKRMAGVKDSGTFLPGHGGILDRIDSLTSTLPVILLLFIYL